MRARGLARGRIGQDPPRHGWRRLAHAGRHRRSYRWPYQLRALDVFGGIIWSSELEERVGFLVHKFRIYLPV